MNSKECEEQLKSLIEHFKNGGLDFNTTDIKSIEHLLLENKILHNKIDKAIETIESWHFALDWAENDRLKIIKEILKDSDVDE